ncbi:EAL and HDOD domain-containing protein [Pinirhizobacter soli]|uniref:EAL and HDOD domain-containing protein n=1 Tax=Pinirhizobacter soli TaxID=2786953 RepID=UPI00202A085C|nr:HDOD domain-containing protein [Pinirhizobacter soli]
MSVFANSPSMSQAQVLPVVRQPILDRQQALFAYELAFPRGSNTDGSEALTGQTLAAIADGSLKQLVRDNRAFLHVSRELLVSHAETLRQNARLGVCVGPALAGDEEALTTLRWLKASGCLLMLEDFPDDLGEEQRAAFEVLLFIVQYAMVAVDHRDVDAANARIEYIKSFNVKAIATGVDTPEDYARFIDAPVDGFQGKYLLKPERVDVPRMSPSKLGLLRLIGAMNEPNNGPIELGKIIRDDAILSYKLLGCVNSAYFALPRQLKSVEQAAVFFGVNRMRNWISTMALGGMDERPPELLRLALVRAQMCERLASGKPALKEMAFTAGLFSLLDTLMNAPMSYVLEHLPLATEINQVLLENTGPFAPILDQVRQWESGDVTSEEDIHKLAAIYFEAAQWADHVYAFADAVAS